MLEHFADALVGLSRALQVLVGADLLADLLALQWISQSCCTGERCTRGFPLDAQVGKGRGEDGAWLEGASLPARG